MRQRLPRQRSHRRLRPASHNFLFRGQVPTKKTIRISQLRLQGGRIRSTLRGNLKKKSPQHQARRDWNAVRSSLIVPSQRPCCRPRHWRRTCLRVLHPMRQGSPAPRTRARAFESRTGSTHMEACGTTSAAWIQVYPSRCKMVENDRANTAIRGISTSSAVLNATANGK